MHITIINGPNLNLLGNREKSIYGDRSFEDFFNNLKNDFPGVSFEYLQTNVEGELVNFLQNSDSISDYIILNAAAYTHTSIAIADAIAAISTPVIEVHISNVLSREEPRHTSLIGGVCSGTIFGFGIEGYRLAVEACVKKII